MDSHILKVAMFWEKFTLKSIEIKPPPPAHVEI